jgi:hypothetical protein
MRWFAALCLFLQHVADDSSVRTHLRELIFLSLSVPCFKLSHFFFKLTYSVQQRELVCLGRECVRLGGKDLSLQFDSFRSDGSSIVAIIAS